MAGGVGSVNLAEFFVPPNETATFYTMIGLMYWQVIAGLILGRVRVGAQAACICKEPPQEVLMIMVGALITVLSIRTILKSIQL